MLEFGDSAFYLDLKAFDSLISLTEKGGETVDKETKETYNSDGKLIKTEKYTRTTQQGKEIDAAKYDVIKTFIEFIIDSTEEIDDSLGAERGLSKTSLAYKIVFNTLINEGIIKEK